jgi:adenine/guanine phosphoribosyltransferase-like PRPP-binding protein
MLIREIGKLFLFTVSVIKPSSHIASNNSKKKRVEIKRNVVFRGASVIVIDDILFMGKTLYAVLQLLNKADIGVENISIMAVAEFPVYRNRELLRRRAFSRINI